MTNEKDCKIEMPDPYSSEMCKECKATYAKLYAEGKTDRPFPPICRGDIGLQEGYACDGMSPQEKAHAVLANPVTWARYELRIEPRWYQKTMLGCSARQLVLRCGRRIGKSFMLVLRALHSMSRNKNYKVIVIAPYQAQIDMLFGFMDEFISNSRTIKSRVKRRVKSPQLLELNNGATVRGFPSGINSGGRSDKVRGQGADEILIDEVDYLPEDDIDSIVAILASNKETKISVSSTPTGRKTKYYGFCTYKEQGWKEWHYTSKVSPEWTEETEIMLRGMYSEAAWEHEIEAEFGEFEEGAFSTPKLADSLQSYTYDSCTKKPNCIYSMGVDWNEYPIGVHMVVVEYDPEYGQFRVVDRKVSNDKEFTQTQAVEDIITTYRTWMPNWLWADAGAGGYQIETLKRVSNSKPELKLRKKIRGVIMHEKEIIKDPITKKDVKKQAKALMVDLCVRRVESNQCIFPRIEDAEGKLVDQLRNFKVERFTPNGIPVYSQGVDHAAVAWMVAMYAILLNRTDIRNVTYCKKVGAVPIYNGYNNSSTTEKKRSSIDNIVGSRDITTKKDIQVASFQVIGKPDEITRRKHTGYIKLHTGIIKGKRAINSRARF